MTEQPPAPYPDGSPEEAARDVLPHDERGEGQRIQFSNGDWTFMSDSWRTEHGPAIAARTDNGAFRLWNALLPDGRRVHCRHARDPAGWPGYCGWRRRSDDGRSWVRGTVQFTPDDILFEDGISPALPKAPLDNNVFERATAAQEEFLKALRDDSFAFSLHRDLRVEALCTLDGSVGWAPTGGEAAGTIAGLRDFGETWADFKHGFWPEPPLTGRAAILAELERAGWRYQSDDDAWRLNPEIFRK
jgi:hypothetical protein